MIFHVRPKIYALGWNVRLCDVRVDGESIEGCKVGTPYPNKGYRVVYQGGRRHLDGLLIATENQKLEVVTSWAVDAEYVGRHRVIYHAIDDEFGLASDSMVLWYAWTGFESRWPPQMDAAPIDYEPCMIVTPWERPKPKDAHWRIEMSQGHILERVDYFEMPTIEPERLDLLERRPTEVVRLTASSSAASRAAPLPA